MMTTLIEALSLKALNVRHSLSTLVLLLALGVGVSGLAAESGEQLLAQAEQKLVNSAGFAVDYTVQPEDSAGWPGVVLRGRLVLHEHNSCILTNAGGISILPAALTLVSDEKSHLIVHSLGVDWVPEQPGPINVKQSAGLLARGGITPVICWVVADSIRKSKPDPEDTISGFSLSMTEFKITDAQEAGREQMTGGPARHIQFNAAMGTNQAEHVDLWLDERSGLPIKRVVQSRQSGVLTETYSFRLNPTLASDFFNPRRVAHQMNLDAQILAAEKPAARLLRGPLWGDENLVRDALQAGADANARTPSITGRPGPDLSALMLACMSGDKHIVERLVKAGAEIDASAPSGATALDFAVIFHHSELVDWLRSHGGKEGKRLP